MQLLISVFHEDEVAAAIAGGADIIDVKNPAEGSLGASFPHVIRAVRQLTPEAIPVSAAIGDVPDLPGMASLASAGAAGCGVQYVKVGLMGPRTDEEAYTLLAAVCRAAREQDPLVRVMATAYADADRIGSLPPAELPAIAAAAGAAGSMIDTARKGATTLLTELPVPVLEQFIDESRRAGLLVALAGSLGADDLPRIRALAPDIVGFRGAACTGGDREGRVHEHAVRRLRELIEQD